MSIQTLTVTGRPLAEAVASLCALEVGARVTVQGGPHAGRWLKCNVATPADEWVNSWASFEDGALACARHLVDGAVGILFAWEEPPKLATPNVGANQEALACAAFSAHFDARLDRCAIDGEPLDRLEEGFLAGFRASFEAMREGKVSSPMGEVRVATSVFELGDRVRIVDADDVEGRIVDHTRYLDGSERWGVAYWHNGEREHVNCRSDELERLR